MRSTRSNLAEVCTVAPLRFLAYARNDRLLGLLVIYDVDEGRRSALPAGTISIGVPTEVADLVGAERPSFSKFRTGLQDRFLYHQPVIARKRSFRSNLN